MSQTLVLVCDIIEAIEPDLKQCLDPKFVSTHKKKLFLNESYQHISLLDKIDVSHLEHLYDSYPKKDISFILEALKKRQRLDPSLLEFIEQDVYTKLFNVYSLTPYKYLQAFEGSRLLFLNSQEMKIVIDLLGIFDVKTFLRTSIDQKLNSEIQACLSPVETQFLKRLQKEKEKVAFKKMPLEQWDRKKHTFEAMKYLRGLNRLSKTLGTQSISITQEIILRLPLKDKTQVTQLSTQPDRNLEKPLYEELNLALDFALEHVLKKTHLTS